MMYKIFLIIITKAMPYHNVLVPMRGGKELMFVKGNSPSLWPTIGNIMIEADTKVIPVSSPFMLDDDLHLKLNKPKEYRTYLLCKILLKTGVEADGDEALEEALSLIDIANYVEVVESVFSYQIIKLEYYDFD